MAVGKQLPRSRAIAASSGMWYISSGTETHHVPAPMAIPDNAARRIGVTTQLGERRLLDLVVHKRSGLPVAMIRIWPSSTAQSPVHNSRHDASNV